MIRHLAICLGLLLVSCISAVPLQKTKAYHLTMPPVGKVLLDRQFIGSSVIGGLMWPVLMLMALTAMAARVPDFFQSLLTIGSGGGGGRLIRDPRMALLLRGSQAEFWDERLEDTMNALLRATDAYENSQS